MCLDEAQYLSAIEAAARQLVGGLLSDDVLGALMLAPRVRRDREIEEPLCISAID